jgi:hypothetical protein
MLQFASGYRVLTVDLLRLQAEPGALMKHEFDFVSSAPQPKAFWNLLRGPKHLVHNGSLWFENTAAHLVPANDRGNAPETDTQQFLGLPESMTRGSDK